MEQKLQRMMCEKEAVIDEILTQLQQEGCGRGVYSRRDGKGDYNRLYREIVIHEL